MKISSASKNKLATIILTNPYRSGPILVDLFNDFSEKKDTYGPGFPSRLNYAKSKIDELNESEKLKLLIQEIFHISHFETVLAKLNEVANELNAFLSKDGYFVEITQTSRGICGKIKSTESQKIPFDLQDPIEDDLNDQESEFLKREFGNVSFSKLNLTFDLLPILENRLEEASKCLGNNIPLLCVIAIGSILEGILLNAAKQSPALFNGSATCPKDRTSGKPLLFHEWNLASFIDVSHEIGLIKTDVKRYSHDLRDFRNYIHPHHQMTSKFQPDMHTAKICFQVLKAAIADLSGER